MTVIPFPVARIRQVDAVCISGCAQSVQGDRWFSVDGFLRGRHALHFGLWPDLDQACRHARDLAGRHSIASVEIQPDPGRGGAA